MPCVSYSVREKAGIFMYMAEMRTVTTLFVKLDSYSPEKNKNLLSLQVRFLKLLDIPRTVVSVYQPIPKHKRTNLSLNSISFVD